MNYWLSSIVLMAVIGLAMFGRDWAAAVIALAGGDQS